MDGIEFAVAPVADEKGVLVFCGELRAVAKTNTCRGTRADIQYGWQSVGIEGWIFAGAITPAEVAAGGDETDTCRSIPGGIEVPFHVRVVGEQIAVLVVGGIVLITETDTEQPPVLTIGRDMVDRASRPQDAFHKAFAIWQPRQQVIVAPHPRNLGTGVLQELGLIAAHDGELLAIRMKQNSMRAMFPSSSFE